MRIFTILFLLIPFTSLTQPCSGPGRTPATAIAVCGTLTFQQPFVNPCSGPTIPANNCAVQALSSNSVWYKFHCYVSGDFTFLVSPYSVSDDFDWHLHDYTGHPPGDVLTTNLMISMNLSGVAGSTGCTPTGIGNVNCEGSPPPYNQPAQLIAGHDYLLCVTNWTNSGLGYDVDFTGGSAVLTNNLPPTITSVAVTRCNSSLVTISFSEDVLCSSLSATASEFTITNGTHVISSFNSSCSGGSNSFTEITLSLQTPLTGGNYQLIINNGTDLNTLLDVCSEAIPAGTSYPFTVPVQTPLAVKDILYTGCAPTILKVVLNTLATCSSITANGSEFSIGPGTNTISSIQTVCNPFVPYTDTLLIFLQSPLPPGNYQLTVNIGSDGNTLKDTCGNAIVAGYQFPFTINQITTAPVYDSVQYYKCNPSEIKVFYSNAINCGSVSASGIEFNITGPSPVSIVSVSGDPATCSSGYSNWFIVHLSAPINTFGTYVLHNVNGPDGNSVMDTCYAVQNNAETISFNVLGRPSAVFTDAVQWGCVMDTLVLSHPGGNGINSWTWNFSDNTTASGQSVTHTFPVSTTTATVQLIVSNGICSDTLSRSYTLANAFTADFSMSADTVCINSGPTLTNLSHGDNLQYAWQFGDNTQATGLNPPVHPYSIVNSYDINLFVVNDHGCRDTATKTIVVTKRPVVDFSGLHAQYCTGETISLTANMQGNISSYTWNYGNGVTVSNQAAVNFNYGSQNLYTISLSATDRYCGVTTKDSMVQIYLVPVFDLGKDKTLCPGISVHIGPGALPGYTYLWSNGQTVPDIITALQTTNYTLTIDNNGCQANDAILVKVLDNCLIKVPGAFTPNRDGLNDVLKAINADLATNFTLRVYNRFGQLLFSTNNPLEGWDGTYKGNPMETATYVWQLSYIDPVSKKPVYEKGSSILIR